MTHPKQFEILDRCPVCSSSAISSFRRGTFDYLSIQADQIKITDKDYGKIWDLWRCAACTYIFANPAPTASFIHSLYRDVEDPAYEDEAEGRRQNFLPILDVLERFHPHKGRLFDVGAATGILLHSARSRGWSVDGIETGLWSVRRGREKYGLDIRAGDFISADLGSRLFTAVTMIDFIEHIPTPLQAAEKARRILSPTGTLCLVTPDAGSLAARMMKTRWWHLRPGHLGYFNRKSIVTLLNKAGFTIARVRRYAWTFSAHYLLTRIPFLAPLAEMPGLSSFWKSLRIKLGLRDSFEIYARKAARR